MFCCPENVQSSPMEKMAWRISVLIRGKFAQQQRPAFPQIEPEKLAEKLTNQI
jgi:hypothetical protein